MDDRFHNREVRQWPSTWEMTPRYLHVAMPLSATIALIGFSQPVGSCSQWKLVDERSWDESASISRKTTLRSCVYVRRARNGPECASRRVLRRRRACTCLIYRLRSRAHASITVYKTQKAHMLRACSTSSCISLVSTPLPILRPTPL